MAGKGRPDKYRTHIEPHLDEIAEMSLTMTEAQIARILGVAYSTFRLYKAHYPALNSAIKKGRTELVKELKSTLIRKAKGFNYEERTVIKENGEITREEIRTRASLPDVAAINLLLKNYDSENWANDPQYLKIKQEELKIKKEQAEKDNW